MKSLKIILVLLLGGVFPTLFFALGQQAACPDGICTSEDVGPLLCENRCPTPGPTATFSPPNNPPSVDPTATPNAYPPYETEFCTVDPLTGAAREDSCGGNPWQAVVTPIEAGGNPFYFCSCNGLSSPGGGFSGGSGGGNCSVDPKTGLNLNNQCIAPFEPYVGAFPSEQNPLYYYCNCSNTGGNR